MYTYTYVCDVRVHVLFERLAVGFRLWVFNIDCYWHDACECVVFTNVFCL